MSQHASRPGNLEKGGQEGMSSTSQHYPQFNLLDIEDDRIDPQTMQDLPAQGESKFGDSSGQLFSMYSKVAEDEDDNMIQSSQKDADGILIFVSTRDSIQICLCIKREHHRPAYSLLRSLYSFL
jgi:hypothetical protein